MNHYNENAFVMVLHSFCLSSSVDAELLAGYLVHCWLNNLTPSPNRFSEWIRSLPASEIIDSKEK